MRKTPKVKNPSGADKEYRETEVERGRQGGWNIGNSNRPGGYGEISGRLAGRAGDWWLECSISAPCVLRIICGESQPAKEKRRLAKFL